MTTEAGRRMQAYLRQDWVRNFTADILAIEAVAAVNALPALLDVLDAARATGWNEADGKCWCPESREVTKAPQHEPRCAALRDALRRLDEGEPR